MLDQKLTTIAQQKIGAFVPPIPLQPSDIKAAQVNAAMVKERELQEALLENWLIQWAQVMQTITRRLCNPESPDAVAQQTQAKLLAKLTPEEIMMLVDQFPVKSVMDFTEFKAQQRGMFATSVLDKPLFNQNTVARIMAEGAGDEAFVDSIVIKEGDQSQLLAAQRQQIIENTTLEGKKPVPVLPQDNDWVHMQTLKEVLGPGLMNQEADPERLSVALQHYAAHWEQGVNKKTLPKDQINPEKQWIAQAEKVILELRNRQALMQQQAQAIAQAEVQAEQLVASGQA
jgi:hypothetical protein